MSERHKEASAVIPIVGKSQQNVLLWLSFFPNIFADSLGKTQSGNKWFFPEIQHLFQDSNVPTIEKIRVPSFPRLIVVPP